MEEAIPSKVNFLWVLARDKILTSEHLKLVGFSLASICALCNTVVEDFNHKFSRCPFMHTIWNYFVSTWDFELSAKAGALPRMLHWKDNVKMSRRGPLLWNVVAHVIVWVIWGERNSRIFYDQDQPVEKVIQHVQDLVFWWAIQEPALRETRE